jgi:hypothetical protein
MLAGRCDDNGRKVLLEWVDGWGRPLDLVLLHHRLAFPPSRWKQVRSRLGTGRPHTVVLPDQVWPARSIDAHRRVWRR